MLEERPDEVGATIGVLIAALGCVAGWLSVTGLVWLSLVGAIGRAAFRQRALAYLAGLAVATAVGPALV